MNINSIINTAKRNFIMKFRAYPIEFFWSTVLSGFLTVFTAFIMYKYLFENNVSSDFVKYANTPDYMSYIIVGSIIYTFSIRTLLNISRSLINEMRQGTLDILFLSPLKSSEYLIGNMLEQTITTFIETLILFVITIPFGIHMSINISALILCIFLSLISLFGLSVLLAAFMIWAKETFISQNFIVTCIYLLTGIIFPVQYLPKFIQYISYSLPVTYSLDVFRGSMLLNKGIVEQSHSFAILAALTLVYSILGLFLVDKVLKKYLANKFM